MTMGRQHLVDKTIRPLTTLTSITPAGVIPNVSQAGVIPIGNYKGVPAFWDLDKAVNQPLVTAERAHVMGILNARLEGYDLRTFAVPALSPLATAYAGILTQLTVPMGQVWFINSVVLIAAKDGAAVSGFNLNWRCSLWTDQAAVPSAFGQSFLAADTVGANAIQYSVSTFGLPTIVGGPPVPPIPQATLLRLPGGTTLTMTIVVGLLAVGAAAVPVTMGLYGYVGKPLVA